MRASVLFLGIGLAFPCSSLHAADSTAEGLAQEARTYRQKGYEAQQQGRLEQAMADYHKAMFIDPSYAAPYNDLGVAYEALGQKQNAKEAYLKCVEINPHCLSAYANLAALAEEDGDTRQAIGYWKQRVQFGPPKDPWTEKARQRLARLIGSTSDAVTAQPHEQQAPTMEHGRSSPEGRLNDLPGNAQEGVREQEAQASSEKRLIWPWGGASSAPPARTPPPPSPSPWEELEKLKHANAALEADVAKLTTANAALEGKLKDQREVARMSYDLGLAHTQAKAYPQAIDAFEQSLALNPDNPQAHYHLGLLYQLLGNDPERARTHLRAYLEMSPNDANRKDVEALLGLMQPENPRP